jgi:uncharacterized membrane protein
MMTASLRCTTVTKRLWRNSSRWLLLISLALNLFFVGVAVAMAVRAPTPPSWDRDVFVRVGRLAATLPQADAALLRAQFGINRDIIEKTQSTYRGAQDEIHETLRKSPFDVGAMRTAMAKTSAARQDFEQVVQGIFAVAAERMSPAGRHALADRPPGS